LIRRPTGGTASRARGEVAYLLLTMGVLAVTFSFGVPRPASAAVVSDQPDPAPQTDGRVEDVLLVGGRIYLAGSFTSVDGVPRMRLAAIDANTGRLTGWNPSANATVRDLATGANGGRIFAGGDFNGANSVARNHLAAFDADTGKLDRSWDPGVDRAVYSLAVFGGRVYLGGRFGQVNGQSRKNLAAVDEATGELKPNWNPKADGNVRALVPSPDGRRLYAGGNFDTISGQRRLNLAALNPDTGALKGWRPNPCYPVLDLVAGTKRVYVAGGGTPSSCGAGGFAEAFRTDTGGSVWRRSSDGDFQAVAALRGTLYYGGHFTEIPWQSGNRYVRFAAVDAVTGALDTRWKPTADAGAWAMTADVARGRIYAGGAFTKVNGQRRQGFAQFS
jgi:hypothetical protein